MKQVAPDTFLANTLRFVARVRRTGEPLAITQYGVEVVRLMPEKTPWRQRILGFFGFTPIRGKGVNRCASSGIYLKMR